MSFLKGLRKTLENQLFEAEESAAAEETSEAPARVGRGRAAPSAVSRVTVSASESNDAAVAQFLQTLREETEDDRTEGHRAFYQQLGKLEKFITDPAQRYKAALETAEGVTAKDLLDSIQRVEAELAKEAETFEAEINTAEQQEVVQAQDRLTRIDTELEELQQRVGALRAEQSTLNTNKATAEQKFQRMRGAFAKAAAQFRGDLDTERNNIKAYLA